ncbi:DUF1501 domain-containing protein [Niabella drilacis]|uniref:Tat (Twin-arginine translocation) pathway signal sequence n=1 Tax=Niabella drilacis (strain DSM 25811 / CCM 8410 / CCUG 62505 / LMG 26954 / E90) TaxID=1285928 RepID=A0A1G6JEX9_NIADE|nr:DUF1501 domain-containing protein [Niabella drilacis]SDC17392.1 Protein of unknown function [Niabella drilacis]
MNKELHQLIANNISRKSFLQKAGMGLGAVALGSLMWGQGETAKKIIKPVISGNGSLGGPHFAARARRVVYLCQSGGPSQFETFDYKPLLEKMHGQELPDSVRKGQRLTGMSAHQSSLPLAGSHFKFEQKGQSGAWVSELLPHIGGVVDDICIIRSMFTEQINHDPALTFMQTGNQLPGRPSIGSWLSYGLGSDNENLPAFIVLVSNNAPKDQPLYARLWGNGFLPSKYQGVQFRSGADPVLYLTDPEGYKAADRRQMLDALTDLNQEQLKIFGDPEINNRLAQYEMAFRMQASVPELTDMSDEPDWVFDLYGEDARIPGTYAANCLLARRLLEKDVKFVQLYHQGWDNHGSLPAIIPNQCKATDQASAALVTDLKQRGLLDDTLVVWGGEFGRTNYSQGKLTKNDYGRDHHPASFSMWMAGGGIQPGLSYGETDEFGYNIVKDPVHVHDFQATLLYLLGIDHEKLIYESEGRPFRLTDVAGKVVQGIIA